MLLLFFLFQPMDMYQLLHPRLRRGLLFTSLLGLHTWLCIYICGLYLQRSGFSTPSTYSAKSELLLKLMAFTLIIMQMLRSNSICSVSTCSYSNSRANTDMLKSTWTWWFFSLECIKRWCQLKCRTLCGEQISPGQRSTFEYLGLPLKGDQSVLKHTSNIFKMSLVNCFLWL